MNTFPNEMIDIVGIGASTLDRFIVVDHFPTGREVQPTLSSTTDGGTGSNCIGYSWEIWSLHCYD